MYNSFFKRFIDILLSGAALLVGWPILAIIAIAIKLDSPGPVLFRQQRVGKGKKLFPILKFRTMRTDTPKDMPTHLLQNPDAFITRTGKFLRKTSLDELPQLINIFRGDMAVVGPRPALYNQDDLIAERDRYGANDVRPGLTGLAQVSGRDELAIPVKAKLDGEYVQHITFLGDMKLILRTAVSVVKSEGVVEGAQPDKASGHAESKAIIGHKPGTIRSAWMTVDLEEWYDLDYLKDFRLKDTPVRVLPQIFDFLDMLDREGIKATFFCVANIAQENADILREIVRRGHALGCHGLDHELLTGKTAEQFEYEAAEAKRIIEQAAGVPVTGYRASCFTMDRRKLEICRNLGYTYDSSRIRFKQHPLYRDLDLYDFTEVEDLVHIHENFSEYEVPTLDIGKYSIPISGGGYMRLFPYPVMKILLKMYAKKHENFLIYVHPFELTPMPLPLPKELKITTKFRCLVGRRGNLKKLTKIIRLLKNMGAAFSTLEEDRRERGLQ